MRAMKSGLAWVGVLFSAVTVGCASVPPNLALKPGGEGWHCTNSMPSTCTREAAACDEVNTAQDKGKGIYKCRPQPQAWCYTWAKDGTPEFSCLASAKDCDHNRELRSILAEGEAHKGVSYTDWSGCAAW